MSSKNISTCKFGEHTNIIRDLYKSKRSNDLIKLLVKVFVKTSVKFNGIKDLIKLLKLPIIKYMHTPDSDVKIINYYLNLVKTPVNLYDKSHNKKRAIRVWESVKKQIPPNLKIKRILDFGGNVGDQAHVIGDILKLKKKDVLVVDINEWEGNKWTPRKDITFIHYDKMQKIKSNSVDFIQARHVLHHIKPEEHSKIINNFARILTTDGIIIIGEHDMENTVVNIVDLIHLLFDVVVSQSSTYIKFVNSYYASYHTKTYWINLLSKEFDLYHKTDYKVADATITLYFKKK
jgi:SAM-dependent methyltransferase